MVTCMSLYLAAAKLETETAKRQNDYLASEVRQIEDEIAHYETYALIKI